MFIREYSLFPISYVDVSCYEFNKEVVSIIPKELAVKHEAIVMEKYDTLLTVAVANPSIALIKELERITKCKVLICYSLVEKILNELNTAYETEKYELIEQDCWR